MVPAVWYLFSNEPAFIVRSVVIIGNGIAGITAARFLRKFGDDAIRVISAESDHFYSRTALMYIYMGHMTYENTKPYEDWFWKKNRIELIRGFVTEVDPVGRRVRLAEGQTIEFDVLVIASGSRPNYFGWPGEELRGVSGLYTLQDLATVEEYTGGIERGVIVGGGLIGVELAEMLRSRNIDVSMLVREREYWANILPIEDGSMISRHIRSHHVDLCLETELKEILSDDGGRVRGVVTSRGETIPCQFVGLTAGVTPNVSFLEDSGIEVDRGVLVDEYFRTGHPNIYAIGDCAQFREPRPEGHTIEQLWYTSRMHGGTVAQTIAGEPTPYDRGVWFNSAKFFDVEYQTYGFVPAIPQEGEEALRWEDPSGRRAIRIVYDLQTGGVLGVNLFGVRHHQPVWEKWIAARRPIDEVLAHLAAANIDPEFTRLCEPSLVADYNARHPEGPLRLVKKRGPGIRKLFGVRN